MYIWWCECIVNTHSIFEMEKKISFGVNNVQSDNFLSKLLFKFKDVFPMDVPLGRGEIDHAIDLLADSKTVCKPLDRLSMSQHFEVEKVH